MGSGGPIFHGKGMGDLAGVRLGEFSPLYEALCVQMLTLARLLVDINGE